MTTLTQAPALTQCDMCGDLSNSAPELPCGRDLSEEVGDPDGSWICTGTTRTVPLDDQ